MVALPCTPAGIATPRATTGRVNFGVAPLAHAGFAAPRGERAGDAFAFECAHLDFAVSANRCASCGCTPRRRAATDASASLTSGG
ncbi:MAG: hypothetical protein EBT38_06085 [Acidimicrobiia bacterium]|nr:hypothetical protein [Acidimicrobiia bacterium]